VLETGGVRVAFFGLPLAALLLHADGIDVRLAVLSRAEMPGGRRLRRVIGGDRVFDLAAATPERLLAWTDRAAPDLIVSWFWTRRLPIELVRRAPLGGIGVHPSLLPRHRGADPYFAAIDQGDAESGVTAHRIEADYDTGAILGQTRLTIDPSWNAWQLARRLDRPSIALLRATVGRIARGEPLAERPQDERFATEAPVPSDEALALRWQWPTEKLLRRIRALAPWPGAVTELAGRALVIQKARAVDRPARGLEPGEAYVENETAIVRTGDGAIALVAGQADDEFLDEGSIAKLVSEVKRKN
jgi:methionyl-tRNA formyltransferase